MPKIVISYRRRDSEAMTGRIFDRLVAHYGRDAVFRDIDNIPAGIDFRAHITDVLVHCDILLAIVGPNWAGRSSRARRARIDDENDFVRIEVETALQRDIPVIPVLLASSKMPSADQVPEGLKAFVYRQAVLVDPGRDFEHHVDRLMREIDRISLRRSEATAPEPETEAPRLVLPDKPSIAVLPFANMSGDPEQEYFTDGMVEEIITALSRIRWLFVIARNSSFTYKGQALDVKQVGRELGVRYVLEGSVRKGGSRVRITAQLIDALSGAHLWADRFDGSLEDVFELQDKVAVSVAGVIEPALQAAEIQRSAGRPTHDLTAYDLYLRGFALSGSFEREHIVRALDLLGQAIERDPRYGPALALAARYHFELAVNEWTDDLEANSRNGVGLARRAIRAAPDDPDVLATAAFALGYFGDDIDFAISLVDRSLALNPSLARGWSWSGVLRNWAGQPDLGIQHFETALRLSPRDRVAMGPYLTSIGVAHFFSRRFDDAVANLRASLEQHPNFTLTYRFLAASYAHTGRLGEASEIIARLRTMTPVVVPSVLPYRNPEHREFFLLGLRLAAGEAV
jgi:adenylate cyclase